MKNFVAKSALATGAALLLAGTALAQSAPTLRPGQSRNGNLTERSPRMTENDMYLDRYTISGEAGDRVAITMTSTDFDSYVEVGRMMEDYFEVLASDDDGGGELNARLVFTFPEAGSYVLRARTFQPRSTGAYTLAVETLPPPPPPPAPIAIQRGQTLQGSFTADSPTYGADDPMLGFGGAGRHYAFYTLTGAAGETATITLRSTDFDAYLEVGADSPLGFAAAMTNDDMAMSGDMMMEDDHSDQMEVMPATEDSMMYGGSLDSQLMVTFQSAGTIMIRATTLGADTVGSYTLSVE